MTNFRQIIEYQSVSQKVNLLEDLLDRGLDEQEREEVISTILSYFPNHNDWPLVLLIDLSTNEGLISKQLLNLYLSGLLIRKTFYIKLSILDYIRYTKYLYMESDIKIDFSFIHKLAYDKTNRVTIRNQALFLLMDAYPTQVEILFSDLIKNLEKTNDYRTYIRMYNNLLDNNLYKKFNQEEILRLIKKIESKDLGRAVRMMSEELESKLLE